MQDKRRIFAVAIFFVAIIVGQLGLHNRVLWYDEAVSILEAGFGPDGIWSAATDEGIPPLYNLALSAWMKVRDSELWARELSVLFGALAAVVIFLFALELTTLPRAIAVSILFAFIPYHLWHAQELRMYALVEFFVAASFLEFYRYLKDGKRADLVLYVLFSAPVLWLHYVAGLAFLAQATFFALNVKGYKQRLLPMMAGFAAVGVVYLPWLPNAYHHFVLRTSEFWLQPMKLAYLWSILGLFAGALKTASAVNGITPWVFLLVFSTFTFLLFRSKRRDVVLMLWLWLVVPLVVVFLVSLKKNLLLARSMLYLLPPFVLLLAWMLGELERLGLKRAFVVGVALISVLSAVSLRAYLFEPNWWAKSAARRIAKMIDEFYSDGDIVIHTSRFSFRPLQYYLKGRDIEMCLIKETEELPKLFELIGRFDCPQDESSVKRIWFVGYSDFQDAGYHQRAFDWYAKNHRFIEVSYFDDFFLIGLFGRGSGRLTPPGGL